ncbi:unnamed protein product [Paramecium sonneborni]|uniref:Uncharacterized protein n=1 Tax=Paramecium sonneborni TaxID=65129 RepID=A0A8S1RRD7_9CILI|nr:unnamed protein product [Paramecium sonneborni]
MELKQIRQNSKVDLILDYHKYPLAKNLGVSKDHGSYYFFLENFFCSIFSTLWLENAVQCDY